VKRWRAGCQRGQRRLLEDRHALDDARHAVDVGLLDGFGVTIDQLRIIGEQLIVDAVEPLVRLASESGEGA
jgi:hypothetical protein